ncbi:DUF559 domain-containing protein [Ureibacillus suwonensis]|uniref:DUF559 domain-containing protein n=1 Tax=Ureibacillus suwonensis TaxID=313007 RepID=A0ABW0REX0_9BACL
MERKKKDYWNKKFSRNKERDAEVNNYYKQNGWHIKRVWEHEVKQDLNKVVDELADFIEQIKNQNKKL